jgi:tetratricopeptide (TPR) repeat protein
MKNFVIVPLLVALFVLLITQIVSAEDEKYLQAMQKNIKLVYQAKSIAELQSAVNAFDRISTAEKSKWEPLYYAGFGSIMLCDLEKDAAAKDRYLDQAQAYVDKAKALKPEDAEIIALEGFVYMMRLAVDPGSRGQQLAPKAMQTLQKAVALDPNNPRALALLAQMQFGTAQFFGSPTTEACQTVAKALEKFEAASPSQNALTPQWGKHMAEGLKPQCH